MSCLSDVDIKKEIGRNIFIYPLNLENIKGSTINLTASNFAWSNGKKIISEDGKTILIPPHQTALIETKEVIYVSEKICGTYHSKVRLVSIGLGHIGTTLDPKYIGPSLIALHNNSAERVPINVGESIVSLMFCYLENESTKMHNNSSGHLELLNGCEGFGEIDKFLDQDWCNLMYE